MNLEVMLIGNSFFLLVVLAILLFTCLRTNTKTSTFVEEDIKKIKEKINEDN